MYQSNNTFPKRMMVFVVLSAILCLVSFFWLSFTARRFNFSGFFYLSYYVVMYSFLCVTIFGLYSKRMLQFRYYIVFLLGIAVGFLIGSISWVFSMIITDYNGFLRILNDGVSGFFNFISFHILISSLMTFDFLIGALSVVLAKYLWRDLETREH